MSDQRLGNAVRRVRIRLGWRQDDVAAKAGVSQSTVSRLERGHLESLSMEVVRRVAAAVDVQVAVIPRWRGGDLDRLLNAGHSFLHNDVAATFRDEFPEWTIVPEVSFAIRGERGVIDILAWHAEARALLIIELKTDIVDVNELLGTFDRKRRLVWQIARERGWNPTSVSGWLIVAPSRTNRSRLAAHAAVLRAAFPLTGKAIRAWLRDPSGSASALSMWRDSHRWTGGPGLAPVRRVRRVKRPRTAPKRGRTVSG
jgi:transcriptional regulator with XRE-family HTH domain